MSNERGEVVRFIDLAVQSDVENVLIQPALRAVPTEAAEGCARGAGPREEDISGSYRESLRELLSRVVERPAAII